MGFALSSLGNMAKLWSKPLHLISSYFINCFTLAFWWPERTVNNGSDFSQTSWSHFLAFFYHYPYLSSFQVCLYQSIGAVVTNFQRPGGWNRKYAFMHFSEFCSVSVQNQKVYRLIVWIEQALWLTDDYPLLYP